MSTRTGLRTELARRLGDSGNAIWSTAELDGFLDTGITGLYPYWFMPRIATTTATDGPMQPAPSGCRRLYMLGLKRSTSTRTRLLRNWAEGDGEAFVPKTGISGDTLVWGWTEGWEAPASGTEVLNIPVESEEAVILRAQISAIEKLLSDRVSAEKYHAIQVRQAITEDDLSLTLDALHTSLREHLDKAMELPKVQR